MIHLPSQSLRKKTSKPKDKKGPSKMTGYRLYMFGIKESDDRKGKIVEIIDSDELEEFKQDKSKGEIRKEAFSRASKIWKAFSDEEKAVYNDEAKEFNASLE